ncbi:hypothetical protein K488DRAFT_71043 [Vararia minispora EC-137]|uniref:Uncharacterized protein n=1 Tax=Vararia minispora EC-137 TaxID=1314806 RepID=A0ACB8QJL7_9AGAM|nr:hypothetical protein K488DRAFT_71043 [Vararia minispora EC-137]
MSAKFKNSHKNQPIAPDMNTISASVYVCFAPEKEHGRVCPRKQGALQTLMRFTVSASRKAYSDMPLQHQTTRYALSWTLAKPFLALGSPPSQDTSSPAHVDSFPRRPPPRRLGRPRDDTPLRYGVVVRQAMFAQGQAEGIVFPSIHPEALVQRLAEERRELRRERERELREGRETRVKRRRDDTRQNKSSEKRRFVVHAASVILRLAVHGRANRPRSTTSYRR